METKKCTKCGEAKAASEFSKDRSKKDGLFIWCKQCARSYNRKYHSDNRVGMNEASSEYGKKNREKIRNRVRERDYGVTPEDCSKILAIQGGGCGICGKTENPNGKSLSVDHCHATGQPRGILCDQCNTSIAKLGDNLEGIRKAIAYLEGKNERANKAVLYLQENQASQ